MAERIGYTIDDAAPDSRQYQGRIIATTRDGQRHERIEPFNRGSPDHPLRADEVREKFHRNASTRIAPDAAAALERFVLNLESERRLDVMFETCSP